MAMTAEAWRAMSEAQKKAALTGMTDADRVALKATLESAPALPAAAPSQKVTTPTGTPVKDTGTTGAGAGFTGTLQGLTFGTSEEIGGGLRALIPGGEGYEDYVARQRALQAQQQAEHPYAYGAGEIGGALAGTLVPGVGWVSGPARAAKIGSTAARVAASSGRGAVLGGTGAAAHGAGTAEGDWVDRTMAGPEPRRSARWEVRYSGRSARPRSARSPASSAPRPRAASSGTCSRSPMTPG